MVCLSWTLLLFFNHSGRPLEQLVEDAQVPIIGVFEASKGLINGDAVFVDARSFEVYKAGFVPNALSWPAGSEPSPELLEAMRKAPRLIVYCDGPGCRAGEDIARQALGMKFQNVLLMEDGYRGWLEKGMPVLKFPDDHGGAL